MKKLLVIVSIIAASFSFSFVYEDAAQASCSGSKDDGTCVSGNCKSVSQYIKASDCLAAVRQCANTAQIGGLSSISYVPGTEEGNCSNALVSCYTNEIDTTACNDKDVLAFATTCNNGNVGADGSGPTDLWLVTLGSGCGIDNAIDQRNAAVGGQDYNTNSKTKQDRIDSYVASACNNANLSDVNQIKQCETNIDNSINECYDQNGGTGTKITNDTLQQCMATKAKSPNECSAAGGTWVNNKCTLPPPPTPPKCKDGSTADANGNCPDGSSVNDAGGPGTTTSTVKGGCGQAKTNLINCDTNARGGEVLSTVLQYVVQALSILVGIGAVGGIVWESIQYAQAQDDQGAVSNARKRIRDIVIGLFVYGFMIAIINWLVPGGVIK
ncbi:MAG: hypothetical protein H6797_05880 [Candidatus Nomurabacteria bacterium]|nr:MAG: hypothetical protein H6797_05880 [Candidatus Nomurabacteria bacterium]